MKQIQKPVNTVTAEDIRSFLSYNYTQRSAATYRNVICSLRRFFRDYLKMEITSTFRLPPQPFRLRMVPTDNQTRQFYDALDTPKQRCCYLFYATSGLRKNEILSTHFDDIDRNLRMIVPVNGIRGIKNTFVSFYNEEAKTVLEHEYLPTRTDSNTKLFPFMKLKFFNMWKFGYQKTRIKITPHTLRDWFCSKMGRLGVPNRYVDAFCGRVPRSVLARHYTDFSPETLKEIYDKANLTILV